MDTIKVWENGGIAEKPADFIAPLPEPAPEPAVIPAATFMSRLTDQEAEALDDAMMAKPIRVRSAWAGVSMQGRDLREIDTLLWDALRAEIVSLFSAAKADDWLAASE